MSTESRPSGARIGAIGFIAIALLCAGFAMFLVSRVLKSKGFAGERVRPIIVARRSLPAAQPIPEDALGVVNFPESAIPPGAFFDVKELYEGGRAPIPSAGILEGEPVVRGRLASSGLGTGLAAVLEPNMRAVVFKAPDAIGRSGLVYPGARVDILATIRDPEGRGPSTKIAVQNARVLAVEMDTDVVTRRNPKTSGGTLSSSSSSSADGTVVTLEVSPEDAEIMVLAAREGSLDLALRNGGDQKQVETLGATPYMFSAYTPTVEEGVEEPAPAGKGSKKPPGPAPTGSRTREQGIKLQAKDPPTGEAIETYQGGR